MKRTGMCGNCGKTFVAGRRGVVGSWCPKCRYKGQRYRLSPEQRRASNLSWRFKLTVEEWETMLKAQKGGCATCSIPDELNGRRLAVDHDHVSGKNRGLLCYRCNITLGKVADDPKLLRKLAEYLERA